MIPKLDEYKKRWHFTSDASIKPGLQAIKKALQLLGSPEKSLTIIHVSGTNGKGSTIQQMEAILRAHGLTTGSFTSPALYDVHDQIRYNNEPVRPEMIDRAFQKMNEHHLSGRLTDFELLTVLAFLILNDLQPDYVFLETGMGGTFDSTNVIVPIASVITSIALDHTQFLGESLEEVATHKAGIIKKEVPVIVGDLPQEALKIVKEIAEKNQSSLSIYGEDFSMTKSKVERFQGKENFTLPKRKMKGNHQRINASLAIETLLVSGIDLNEAIVQSALEETQLAYRFEEIAPNVFLDGAHNPAAAHALRETIEEAFPGEKVDFIIGMLKRKDLQGTLDALIPVAHSFTFIQFNHPEAATAEELIKNCRHEQKVVTNLVDRSIMLIKGSARRKIVTGSLYLLASLEFEVEP